MDPYIYTPDEWRNDLPGPYYVDVNGTNFYYHGGFLPWSIRAPDLQTVRFEIDGTYDRAALDKATYKPAERDELASVDNVALNGTAVEVSYGFTLEPGSANTAKWMVLGQLHSDLNDPTLNVSPPVSVQMQGERMQIVVNSTGADGKQVSTTVWSDAYDIERGHQYQMDIKVIPDPTGQVSRLVVVRDGVTIVDYSGPIGDTYMNGVYWAEGIYRADNATEVVAADYSNLQITSGSAVTFPSAAAFIAAPVVSVSAGSSNSDGTYTVALSAVAKPGTTVSFYEGKTLLGSVATDANGNAALTVQASGSGTHLYYSNATDSAGNLGVTSQGLEVIIDTAANVMPQLVALVKDPNLGAIILTDTNILMTSSATDLSYLLHHPELLAKIRGTFYFHLDQAVTGQSYDRQVQTFSSSGTLLELQRYSSGRLVFDSVYSGNQTVTTSVAADGSSTMSTVVAGVQTSYVTHDAAGNLTGRQINFADTSRELDTYSIDTSAITRGTVTQASGASVGFTYGITGTNYVEQANVTVGGKTILIGRYDASGRLVTLSDLAKALTASYSYDLNMGTVATARVVSADNSYTLTTYLPGTSLVVSTRYYTAAGAYLKQDLSDPAAALKSISPYFVTNAPLAPSVAVSTGTTAGAAAGSVVLAGTGSAETSVTVYDGATAIGTGLVDATGHVAVAASNLALGKHTLTVAAVSTDGATTATSAPVVVDVETQASLLSSLPTLAQDASIAAIVLADSPVIHVANQAALTRDLLYGSVFAKVQGGVEFEIDQTITGKSYDFQSLTYDQTGTLLQLKRLSGGALVQDNVFWGAIQLAGSVGADGSYTLTASAPGTVMAFGANGSIVRQITTFADGTRETDTFNSAGTIINTLFAAADGSKLSTDYGIIGKSYVQQSFLRDASGQITYGIRYDSAGHITMVTNLIAGDTANFTSDSAGNETGYILSHSDNTHSVTSFASGTVTTSFFSAEGALIGQDNSNPALAFESAILTAISGAINHGATSGVLVGTSGNDTLTAGPNATLIEGGSGNDTLIGGAGNDVLLAGPGSDVMTGGGGKDLFWFGPGDSGSATTTGADRITDFTQGDRIDVSSLASQTSSHAALSFIGTGAFDGQAGEVRYYEQGGNTYIAGDLNGEKVADFVIRLDGHHVLHATDFVF